MAVERCHYDKHMLQGNRQHTYNETALPHNACSMSTMCRYWWQSYSQQRNHLPAKELTPLKLKEVAASSAPAMAAVAVVPAPVAPLALVLALTTLFLPPVALPLPLPSAVAEAEPAVVAAEDPPMVEVEEVVPEKAGKPKVAPEGVKEKAPTAGEAAASPDGVGCGAGAGGGASALPAPQQLR